MTNIKMVPVPVSRLSAKQERGVKMVASCGPSSLPGADLMLDDETGALDGLWPHSCLGHLKAAEY